jgi:hypothetical protein
MEVEEKIKKMFGKLKRAARAERDSAQDSVLPDGYSYVSCLNDIEIFAANLPDNTPRVDAIRENVPRARQALEDGRESDLKLYIYRLYEAYNDINSNRLMKRGFTAETAGRHPAWYTKPLIEMCRALRQFHHTYTAEEMFYALPDQHGIDPIEEVRLNDCGELTIAPCSDCNHHDKNMTLASFRKFSSTHIREIGRKRIL